MRFTALIAPNTPMIKTGYAKRPKLNPPQVVTAPVNAKNKPGNSCTMILTPSLGSYLIGISATISSLPSSTKAPTCSLALSVVILASSPTPKSRRPIGTTESLMFLTTF